MQSDELDTLLCAVLARAGEPLTATAANKALPVGRKPAARIVQARLRELADAGRIHRWPGKTEKFSAADPQAFVRDAIRGALANGPRAETEIKAHVPKFVGPLVKGVLAALVAAGSAWAHPKRGTKVPYGLAPPDPLDYLPAEIEAALKKLMKLGFGEAALRAALRRYAGAGDSAPAAVTDAEIVAAMTRLNGQASRGALVYIADLRAALSSRFPDKDAFDRALLALAERGRVQLQAHAWPGRLSDEERHALIEDGRGGCFDAIGLRLE